MTGKNGAYISAEKFVKTWQAANSVEEVSQALGVERAKLSIRASHLRRKGVNLKRFAPGDDRGLDVAALNKLCE